MKGEKDFENIHKNYVPNVKDHVEGSNKGGITSANDNNGENMASDNTCVLNERHLRTNNILWKCPLEEISTQNGPFHKILLSLKWNSFKMQLLSNAIFSPLLSLALAMPPLFEPSTIFLVSYSASILVLFRTFSSSVQIFIFI